jgi:hypothetical protein
MLERANSSHWTPHLRSGEVPALETLRSGLEYRAMNKVQKARYIKCDTPLLEPVELVNHAILTVYMISVQRLLSGYEVWIPAPPRVR